MTDATVTAKLELRWVPRTDERGRVRMEARWDVVRSAPAGQHATQAA